MMKTTVSQLRALIESEIEQSSKLMLQRFDAFADSLPRNLRKQIYFHYEQARRNSGIIASIRHAVAQVEKHGYSFDLFLKDDAF